MRLGRAPPSTEAVAAAGFSSATGRSSVAVVVGSGCYYGAARARGGYPARAGGPWLYRTLVRSGFHAVVVPSGLSTKVQPQR
jgi:hypothetical protein